VGSFQSLRVVFETGKRNDLPVLIEDGDGEKSPLDQFENLRETVYSVVDVIFPRFNEIDDRITIIGVCSSQNNLLEVNV